MPNKLKIIDNIKVRVIEFEYSNKVDVYSVFLRVIEKGIYQKGIISGPADLEGRNGQKGWSFTRFMIQEDYADTLLAELAQFAELD